MYKITPLAFTHINNVDFATLPVKDFSSSLLVKYITKMYKVTIKTNSARTNALDIQPMNNLYNKQKIEKLTANLGFTTL